MVLRSYQSAALIATAGLLVAWFLASNRSGNAAPAGREKVEPPEVQEALLPRERRWTRAEHAAMVQTIEPPSPEPEAMREDERYLSDIVRDAVKGDRVLSLIAHYRNRVLLDSASHEQYREMLSDPDIFEKVWLDLSYPMEVHETLRDNTRRLMEIDYLRDALAWEQNPVREQILTMIEELVLEDNFRDGLGMDMRLSLAGNKQELFSLLHEHAPERASDLVDRAQGTRLGKLLVFIFDMARARAQREQESMINP